MADTTSLTLAQIGKLLVDDVAPVIQRDFFSGKLLLEKLKKEASRVRPLPNGKFEVRVNYAPHSGVQPLPRKGGSIERGSPSYSSLEIESRYLVVSHRFSDIDLEVCKGDPGALANLVAETGESALLSMQLDANRQLWGFGQGKLAEVASNATGTTITVKATLLPAEPLKYIYPGMKLVIGTKAEIEAGTADVVTVATVPTSTTFTVGASVTVAANDIIAKANIYDATGATYTEMMGIPGIIDKSGGKTTHFQGLARNANPWVNAYVEDTAEVLAEAQMLKAVLRGQRTCDIQFATANETLFSKYAALLTSNKRTVNTVKLDGGYSGLSISANGKEIPLILDDDCPEGEMYFIDPSKLEIAELAPLSWMDRGEGVLKHVDGTNEYEVIGRYYANLAAYTGRCGSALRNKTAA